MPGILSASVRVGHLQIIDNRPKLTARVALETLNRREIVKQIQEVDPSFNPPKIGRRTLHELDPARTPDRAGFEITLDSTIGGLLWMAQQDAVLEKIFLADFEAARDQISEDLQLDQLGSMREITENGSTRSLLLIKPTETTSAILSLAGITPAEVSPIFTLFPEGDVFQGRVQYVENSEKLLMAAWDNARIINQAVNWALQDSDSPSLGFIPSAQIKEDGAFREACLSLFEGYLSPFWTHNNYNKPRIYSARLMDRHLLRKPEDSAALLLATLKDPVQTFVYRERRETHSSIPCPL